MFQKYPSSMYLSNAIFLNCDVFYIYIYIHTKRSIVYSQALRIKSVCFQESDFHEHSLNLRSWFLKRGYPGKIINPKIS